MNSGNLIEDVNERANAGKWCKRLYCTTCTARNLRAALAAHSSAEIIESLKALDDDFIAANFDLFPLQCIRDSLQNPRTLGSCFRDAALQNS